MNVILNTPIQVTLSSAFLVQESDGLGTLQFQIEEYPFTMAISTSAYTYDTEFAVGDRVRLLGQFGAFGPYSEGVLQEIIIDSTEDQGDVLFDTVYPDQTFNDRNTIDVTNTDVSVLVRVPLRILAKV